MATAGAGTRVESVVPGRSTSGDAVVNDCVVLAQTASSLRCVWHRPVDEYGDGYWYALQVDLRDDGLVARGRSALDRREGVDLPGFLSGLAQRRRGWGGTLSWMSLEREKALEAPHHGRRVTLAVIRRRPQCSYDPGAWSVRVVFDLERGEQLSNLAREAAAVLVRR